MQFDMSFSFIISTQNIISRDYTNFADFWFPNPIYLECENPFSEPPTFRPLLQEVRIFTRGAYFVP